ncbi:DNA polymerase III subunit delta [Corallococcus sp. H22C18031201]|uniref:DNA polymerase III subunit delta n=1 Tax=Citreicoccus inhibens TaxID=2849499 RepID=UPI000E72587D|nr:DNA polymerase III subunit delta [Citreicoccus inhibens]RJS27933.1 DNA polymerase III subunit delta [Corallococcus sp. H22C18031201]
MDEVLKEVKDGRVWPLYLLWGEEFLVRRGADELVKALVPDAAMGLNLVALDAASPREVSQEVATLPLFPGRKVVLVRDPEFLAPKKGRGDALAKAREAWKAGKRKEGARRLLALAGRAGWGVDKLDPNAAGAPTVEQWKEELNVELADADLAFLKEAAAFCREERISAPEGDASALLDLLNKGVPAGHALVLAATDVDSRNPLLKFAQDKGRLVERKVAARHKDLDLTELSREFLAPFKKKLGPGALEGLKERIGGNIRLLQSELEKLATYAEGATIDASDVALLVHHAREEEFFELTEALQKRELRAALSYAEDAMGQGTHALQLLGAVASIVRSLLENHAWLEKYAGGTPPRTGRDVESRILPKLEAELKATKRKMPNAWALAFGMQAAARYERRELLDAVVACADADLALKSSGNGRLVIERLLWTVCERT